MRERPTELKDKQAAASVGQGLLMEIYQKSFSDFHQNIAQILLTKDVFSNKIKSSNARETLRRCSSSGSSRLSTKTTVSRRTKFRKKAFGDNDILSAMTAEMVGADTPLILSDVNGLYDSNPAENDEARLISSVARITQDIIQVCRRCRDTAGYRRNGHENRSGKICDETRDQYGYRVRRRRPQRIQNIRRPQCGYYFLQQTG